MRETNHDYAGCVAGNYHNIKYNGSFESWDEFTKTHCHFTSDDYNDCDDTYNFIFRYDIFKETNGVYRLELCMMLQRKGIYTHIVINNISQKLLDSEIKTWLNGRRTYIMELWDLEVTK